MFDSIHKRKSDERRCNTCDRTYVKPSSPALDNVHLPKYINNVIIGSTKDDSIFIQSILCNLKNRGNRDLLLLVLVKLVMIIQRL